MVVEFDDVPGVVAIDELPEPIFIVKFMINLLLPLFKTNKLTLFSFTLFDCFFDFAIFQLLCRIVHLFRFLFRTAGQSGTLRQFVFR